MMRNQIKTALSIGLVAIGMVAGAPRAANAQNVWVFDQMDTTNLKPCFRGTGPWVDFGGISAQGQFAWSDFLIIAKAALGTDPAATEALVRFTWVAIAPGATCPDVSKEPNGKTVFVADGKTPVYILVGGSDEVRRVVAGGKENDPGSDQ